MTINLLEPINLGFVLFVMFCVVALGLLWLSVRRGVLQSGYAIAPALLVGHGLVFGVVAFYIRNQVFGGISSFPVSLWAIILLNQAVIMLVLILAYKLRDKGGA